MYFFILVIGAGSQGRPGFLSQLDGQVALFRAQVFARTTQRTYNTHLVSYVNFCEQAGIAPVPISERDLACYAAFLAGKLKYNSMRQYLNVVKLLHEEAGYPNPLQQSWVLASLFKGIKRSLGNQEIPKLPITIDILQRLFYIIDFNSSVETCFWCACTIAFFSFLRKSNLFVDSSGNTKFLTRGNVMFSTQGVVISIQSSKTIQYGERQVQIPLARIHDSPLCPAQAALVLFKSTRGLASDYFFRYVANSRVCALTYSKFLNLLKTKLSLLGYDASKYAGHSFRRGGATLALSCNIPAELVKIHGDWASTAYLRYFDPCVSTKFVLAQALANNVPKF